MSPFRLVLVAALVAVGLVASPCVFAQLNAALHPVPQEQYKNRDGGPQLAAATIVLRPSRAILNFARHRWP